MAVIYGLQQQQIRAQCVLHNHVAVASLLSFCLFFFFLHNSYTSGPGDSKPVRRSRGGNAGVIVTSRPSTTVARCRGDRRPRCVDIPLRPTGRIAQFQRGPSMILVCHSRALFFSVVATRQQVRRPHDFTIFSTKSYEYSYSYPFPFFLQRRSWRLRYHARRGSAFMARFKIESETLVPKCRTKGMSSCSKIKPRDARWHSNLMLDFRRHRAVHNITWD